MSDSNTLSRSARSRGSSRWLSASAASNSFLLGSVISNGLLMSYLRLAMPPIAGGYELADRVQLGDGCCLYQVRGKGTANALHKALLHLQSERDESPPFGLQLGEPLGCVIANQ